MTDCLITASVCFLIPSPFHPALQLLSHLPAISLFSVIYQPVSVLLVLLSRFHTRVRSHGICLPRAPFQVELEVLEDAPARQEGAAQARQDLPAVQVARAARTRHFVGLLDELAVQLVSQGPEVVPRLEDALDDGSGVRHGLQLLERIEDLDGFVLKGGVAFVLEH